MSPFRTLFVLLLFFPGWIWAREPGFDLEEIAKALHFPPGNLEVLEITDEVTFVDGPGVLRAWEISSSDHETFIPVQISIARRGTYWTEEAEKMLQLVEQASDEVPGFGPFDGPEGWDAWLLLGYIRDVDSWDRSEIDDSFAYYSILSQREQGLEIRVKIPMGLPPQRLPEGQSYPLGAKRPLLRHVAGGDLYFRLFADSGNLGLEPGQPHPDPHIAELLERELPFPNFASDTLKAMSLAVFHSPAVQEVIGLVEEEPALASNLTREAVQKSLARARRPVIIREVEGFLRPKESPLKFWLALGGIVLAVATVIGYLRRRRARLKTSRP